MAEKSGKYLWDELCYHYNDGVEGVEGIQHIWNSLKGKIDDEGFNSVRMRPLFSNILTSANRCRHSGPGP